MQFECGWAVCSLQVFVPLLGTCVFGSDQLVLLFCEYLLCLLWSIKWWRVQSRMASGLRMESVFCSVGRTDKMFKKENWLITMPVPVAHCKASTAFAGGSKFFNRQGICDFFFASTLLNFSLCDLQLRFMSDLVNSHVLQPTVVIAIYEAFLSVAMESSHTPQVIARCCLCSRQGLSLSLSLTHTHTAFFLLIFETY